LNSVSRQCYNLDSILRKRHIHSDGSIKFWSGDASFSYHYGLTRIVTGQFEIECNHTDIVVFRSLASLARLLVKVGSEEIDVDTDVSVAIVTYGSVRYGHINLWFNVLVALR
jgi:hypothetical protein